MPYSNKKEKRKYDFNYAKKHKKQKAIYDKKYRNKKKQEKINIINNLTK